MGYYTMYSLEVIQGDSKVIEQIWNTEDEISHVIGTNGCPNEQAKWYNYEEDMRRISKKYPNTVFKLRGDGEESGDIWVEYYKNGKCQKAQTTITFEPFDPKKLK